MMKSCHFSVSLLRKMNQKELLTGVSAIGTLRASMVPHKYPCSRSHPCIRTFTLHASSFCTLETFWVPEKACKHKHLEYMP